MLAAQAATRVQELVPIRYGRMLVSPFTFYRGAAAVMAADLASDTRLRGSSCRPAATRTSRTSARFAAPDRRLVFSPNDFDETLPGPWEWDVKRMAASVEIAGRDVGLPADRRQRIVMACVREYREAMRGFAERSHLDVWYERLTASELVERFGGELGGKGRIVFAQPFAQARGARRACGRSRSSPSASTASCAFAACRRCWCRCASCFDAADARDETAYIRELLDEYAASLDVDRRHLFGTYRFVDMARKVVGVGSVGTRAWVFLLVGREGQDPLVLQAKEAQPSVLEPHLGASEFDNNGERVVRGQRISQAASDIFLGWQRSEGLDGQEHDFYVRQLWDWKASADLSTLSESGLHAYTRACGWSLARAHARSGDRLAIAAYLGARSDVRPCDRRFSSAYADQNERDHQRLVDAVAAGEVAAAHGV